MNEYINVKKLLKKLNNNFIFKLSTLNNYRFGFFYKKDDILIGILENNKKEALHHLFKKKSFYYDNNDCSIDYISPFIPINDICYINNNTYIKYDLIKDWCILKNINISDCIEYIDNLNVIPQFNINEIEFLLEKANYSGKKDLVLKLEQLKRINYNNLNQNKINNIEDINIIEQKIELKEDNINKTVEIDDNDFFDL